MAGKVLYSPVARLSFFRHKTVLEAMKFFRSIFLRTAAAALVVGMSASGCGEGNGDVTGQLKVAAGLPPVAYLAKRVGGEAVAVRTMLPEGRNPHDYSPGPREVRDAASSRVFFTTGMRFENALVRPLHRGKTRIVDVTRGIDRLPMELSCGDHDHGDGHHDHDHEHEHEHGEALDPHVWLGIDNACRMAENIRDELSSLDPARAETYRDNCRRLTDEFQALQRQLKEEFAPYAGRRFYVYHPAFGYFAKMLGLRQEAVELGGREVTPARMAEIVKHAEKDQVRTIFVQPQFSPSVCRALERELHVRTVPADPLREDLRANFADLAQALKTGFDGDAGGTR